MPLPKIIARSGGDSIWLTPQTNQRLPIQRPMSGMNSFSDFAMIPAIEKAVTDETNPEDKRPFALVVRAEKPRQGVSKEYSLRTRRIATPHYVYCSRERPSCAWDSVYWRAFVSVYSVVACSAMETKGVITLAGAGPSYAWSEFDL